jgi:hypothetical protein
MKLHPRKALALLAATAACLALPGALDAAVGEVSLSGSTWTGRVDGVTRYTGSNMSAAGNACVAAMSSGTLRIYNGGNTGGTINLKSNVTVDAWGNTLTGVSGAANGVIRARNSSATGAKNVRCEGGQWFGLYFQTSSGQTFSGISGGAGILMRIDNCAGGTGSNFNGGSPNCTASGGHGVETMGINTATLGTVTATDRSGGCGLLFNMTNTGRVTNVNATRCNPSGGYAGYRIANSNRDCWSTGTVTSNTCGRGFFSLTGSNNSAVSRLTASSCRDVGVWIQDCVNVRVVSGSVSNTPSCTWVSGSGSYATVTCN